MQPDLHVSVRPEWAELERVRSASSGFLANAGLEQDAIDAVTMVACELSENAIKYGRFDAPEAEVALAVTVDDRAATVEVKNPVGAGRDEELRRLDQMIQWIRGYQDPFQAYVERLRIVSAQSLDTRESGLGLVRIAYEGQSVLDFYVDEHDVLAVSAVFDLHGRGRRQSR
jgi:hypothetical protein